jgi:hypothetical protein
MQVRPYDLVLFGGSCAVSGMMLMLAADAFEAGRPVRSVVLPVMACLLSLLAAGLALRTARLREGDQSAT